MYINERFVWVFTILLACAAGYFVGQKSVAPVQRDQVSIGVTVDGADPSNEISKSFGWADAPQGMEIEVVDVVKGVRSGRDDYPHPTPALKFALKNIGTADLDSFGINVLIKDEQNKRTVASYGQASGYIEQGWTTRKFLMDALERDWKDLLGVNKIDFPVTMNLYASTSGGDKLVLRVVFDPSELQSLPVLEP